MLSSHLRAHVTLLQSVQPLTAVSLHRAAGQGDIAALRAALDAGVPVDCVHDSRTALQKAADAGHFNAVKFLVERKASVDLVPRGWTPLQAACYHDCAAIAAFLLDSRASINKQSGGGYSALMLAVAVHAQSCVKLLLERKADMTLRQNSDQTALDLARDGSEIWTMLKFASTAAPPPAPPAPRVETAVATSTES